MDVNEFECLCEACRIPRTTYLNFMLVIHLLIIFDCIPNASSIRDEALQQIFTANPLCFCFFILSINHSFISIRFQCLSSKMFAVDFVCVSGMENVTKW